MLPVLTGLFVFHLGSRGGKSLGFCGLAETGERLTPLFNLCCVIETWGGNQHTLTRFPPWWDIFLLSQQKPRFCMWKSKEEGNEQLFMPKGIEQHQSRGSVLIVGCIGSMLFVHFIQGNMTDELALDFPVPAKLDETFCKRHSFGMWTLGSAFGLTLRCCLLCCQFAVSQSTAETVVVETQ